MMAGKEQQRNCGVCWEPICFNQWRNCWLRFALHQYTSVFSVLSIPFGRDMSQWAPGTGRYFLAIQLSLPAEYNPRNLSHRYLGETECYKPILRAYTTDHSCTPVCAVLSNHSSVCLQKPNLQSQLGDVWYRSCISHSMWHLRPVLDRYLNANRGRLLRYG
jgi:hypothetical protein